MATTNPGANTDNLPLPAPFVTVAIPTRNRGDLITETLQSLLRLRYPSMEILIVDQSTNDDTKHAVLAVADGDKRVRLESVSSVGSSAARNHAARCSSADIIAYTDDDCLVTEGWLEAIVREFSDARISAVYGRLVPHGTTERTGTEVGFKPARARGEFSRRVPPWYIGHGGNMSFRRLALLDCGGFDPCLGAGGLFGACEDPDIAYRFLATGKIVSYIPDALVYHKHWKDWPAQHRMERNYALGAGAQFLKYIRCGDSYGWFLLTAWVWQLGIRRIGSGLFKWRSMQVIQLGVCQLLFPWVGAWRSRNQPVDKLKMLYVES